MKPSSPRSASQLTEHMRATRRHFLALGSAGILALQRLPLHAESAEPQPQRDKALQDAIDEMESWLTPQDEFRDVSRGTPKPHSLSPERRAEVGLTRETWQLEVVSDKEHPATLGKQLTKEASTALDFAGLMKLAETKSVRIPKVMTCLNIGCPLGMGIWEGVPMREAIWLTQPKENLRRVFYYGFHNDDEKQMFRSSLPVGRVLEDVRGLPPVILCYKLNGQWLSPERGGPVRVVAPEDYGFKSVKWLTHLKLSNIPHANDTYAEKNNDVDSDLKTFCATLDLPTKVAAGEPIPVTGWAQAGISGLSKVQIWAHPRAEDWPSDDPHFQQAPWRDAELLPPPPNWGGVLGEPSDAQEFLRSTKGFHAQTGRPLQWPLSLAKAHWAAIHPGLPAGEYVFRCRTIDQNGAAQPMPRPFRKSGHAAIEMRRLQVVG